MRKIELAWLVVVDLGKGERKKSLAWRYPGSECYCDIFIASDTEKNSGVARSKIALKYKYSLQPKSF